MDEIVIEVLYEDEYLLCINKPSGIMVHSDGRSEEKTLIDWLAVNRPEIKEVGEAQTLQNGEVLKRPGIVHRLDKETSGVLLIAKTAEAFFFLKDQFKNRKIEKTYRAFVYGLVKEKKGIINKPIGRSSTDFRKWSAERGAKGELREAITAYEVLKQDKDFSYIEAKPKTGRTHQIRVHMKALSHPLVCDSRYAPKKEPGLGFTRLALHALSINFTLPSGKSLRVEAPLPSDFLAAEKLL